MRDFYQKFPMWNAVRTDLSWTHYRTLLRVEIVRDPVVLEFLGLPNADTLDDCIPKNPCKIYAFFSATLQSKNSILHVIGRTLPFSDPGIADRNR